MGPQFYLPEISSGDVDEFSFLPRPVYSLLLSIGPMSVTSQSIHWTEDPSILEREGELGRNEDPGIMVHVDAPTYLHLNDCQLLW
jgi:hypothetical protein